jgi:hypothetical protein
VSQLAALVAMLADDAAMITDGGLEGRRGCVAWGRERRVVIDSLSAFTGRNGESEDNH